MKFIVLVIIQDFPLSKLSKNLDPSIFEIVLEETTHFMAKLHTTDLHVCGNFRRLNGL